jgi:hypothetical protein
MWYFPFRFSNQNFVCSSHLSHACCMHHLFHPSWYDHLSNV